MVLYSSQVIDIGSGRGYLGCHLSLMHQLQVLGVDSSPTNTSSADDRKKRLEKHWKGLIRNATEPKVTFPNRKNQKKKKPTFKEDSLDGNSVPSEFYPIDISPFPGAAVTGRTYESVDCLIPA